MDFTHIALVARKKHSFTLGFFIFNYKPKAVYDYSKKLIFPLICLSVNNFDKYSFIGLFKKVKPGNFEMRSSIRALLSSYILDAILIKSYFYWLIQDQNKRRKIRIH